MSELYRHLLIPRDATFLPEPEKVAGFFQRVEALEAMPIDAKYTVIILTGRTRPIGRNPQTGEVFHGPELKVSRSLELSDAVDTVAEEKDFDLIAEVQGPAAIPPFDLYSADDYRTRQPGILWEKPYELNIRCKLRQQITHFLHSFGCKCDLNPNEPAVFKNPWNDEPIQTGALGCARFWIEFGIGDYLIPMVTNELDILDTRLVKAANDIFGIEFGQGCIRNDD